MKTLKTIALAIVSWAWFLVVLFFDPDSALYVASAPAALSGIGTVLGNIVWLVGVLFGFMAGMLTYLALSPTTIPKMFVALVKADKPVQFLQKEFRYKVLNVISAISCVTFMGAGYWFTGTMWLLAFLAGQLYRYEVNRQVVSYKELDDEKRELYHTKYAS